MDTHAFMLLAGVLTVMTFGSMVLRQMLVPPWTSPTSAHSFWYGLLATPMLLLFTAEYYAFVRAVAASGWNRILAVFLASIVTFGLIVAPLALGLILTELPRATGLPDVIADIGGLLAFISPLTHMINLVDGNLPRELEGAQAAGTVLTYLIHLPLTAAMLFWAIRVHRRHRPRPIVSAGAASVKPAEDATP